MKKIVSLLVLLLSFSASHAKQNEHITTMEDGVLSIAVTGICKDNSPHHNCWVYSTLSSFAEKYNLTLKIKEVSFDQSWTLASTDQVDIVATGITPLRERQIGNASYSNPYSIVKRGIRIKRANVNKYRVIADFKGQSVAAVKGMTSEKDLRNRAPAGVMIVSPATWEEVYQLFQADKIAGVAEGFYVFPDDDDDINTDEHTLLVDIHDLEPGLQESNRFVVRNASTNLLLRLNEHIQNLGLPNHRPR